MNIHQNVFDSYIYNGSIYCPMGTPGRRISSSLGRDLKKVYKTHRGLFLYICLNLHNLIYSLEPNVYPTFENTQMSMHGNDSITKGLLVFPL